MFGFSRRIDIDPSPPFHPALRFPDGTPIPILGADDEPPREYAEDAERVPSSEAPGEDSPEAAAEPPSP